MNYDPEMPELPKRLSSREAADLLGFHGEASIRALIKVGVLKPMGELPQATGMS